MNLQKDRPVRWPGCSSLGDYTWVTWAGRGVGTSRLRKGGFLGGPFFEGCECGESNSDFKLGKLTRYLYATLAEIVGQPSRRSARRQAWELIFSTRTFLAAVPTTCSRTLPFLKKRRVGML